MLSEQDEQLRLISQIEGSLARCKSQIAHMEWLLGKLDPRTAQYDRQKFEIEKWKKQQRGMDRKLRRVLREWRRDMKRRGVR